MRNISESADEILHASVESDWYHCVATYDETGIGVFQYAQNW